MAEGSAESDGDKGGKKAKTAPRYILRVPVEILTGAQSGKGVTHDMSPSGVRIEEPKIKLTEGTKVRLRFAFYEKSAPIEIAAHVVRMTPTGGFCAQFEDVDARTRQLLTTLLPTVGGGRWREAGDVRFSGKLSTHLGPELHKACVEAAQAKGMSLNDWVTVCLQKALEQK